MSTLATYKTLTQNEVDDTSSRAGSVVEQAIQDTYQEILRFTIKQLAGTTEEDIVATASQRYVTPTNTYQDIKNVLWKNSSSDTYRDLGRITEDEYYEKYVNSSASDPLHFYMNVLDIYFDIAPNNAGTVRVSGVKVQDELSGATISVIPDRYEQIVIKGSVAHFKAYEGLQDAREYFKIYRGPYFEQGKVGGALKTMIDDLNARQPKTRPKLYGK